MFENQDSNTGSTEVKVSPHGKKESSASNDTSANHNKRRKNSDVKQNNCSNNKENTTDGFSTDTNPDHHSNMTTGNPIPAEISSNGSDGNSSKGTPPTENETPLFVTCGPNKAMLYLERLDKGSKGASVYYDNWWWTPNEFQKMSGRGTAKDWKRSIKHHGRSLKLLMGKSMLFLNPPVCKCDYCTGNISPENHDSGGEAGANSNNSIINPLPLTNGQASEDKADQQESEETKETKQASVKELDSLGYGNKSCEKSPSDAASAGLSDESSASRDNTPSGRSPRSFGGINCTGSGEVVPALSDNGVSDLHEADDSEKIGANNGGNDHRSNDEHNFHQPNGTHNKLTSLMTGNPDNEGNNLQKLATKYRGTPPSIINSVSGGESSQNENSTDKYASLTSEATKSNEVNGEIRNVFKMDLNGEVGNSGDCGGNDLQADDINIPQKLPVNSPQEGKGAEGFYNREASILPTGSDGSAVTQEATSNTPVTSLKDPDDDAPHSKITSNAVSNDDDLKGTDSGNQPTAELNEEESNIMSPNKEARLRLINIIEGLKHYKKYMVGNKNKQNGEIHPEPTSTKVKDSTKQTSTKVKNKSPKKCRKRSGIEPYKHRHSTDSDCSSMSGNVEPIDDTSHATGTVHWGMPKGHIPKYSNNHSTAAASVTSHKDNTSPTDVKIAQNVKAEKAPTKKHSVKLEQYSEKSPKLQSKKLSKRKDNSREPSSPTSAGDLSGGSAYSNIALQYLMSPPKDMNAYFEYVSQCLKDGQIPNIYGFYNSLASPVTSETARKCSDPQKRPYADPVELDAQNNDVIDLSVKKRKTSDSNNRYNCSSDFSGFRVDENGAVDLTTK